MKKSLLVLSALILFPVSAFSFGDKPAWISGKSKDYPESRYVIGVGIGNDLDSARSSARAEIAKIFKARVTQLSQDTLQQNTSGGAASFNGQINTEVYTEEIIEGVEIAGTWVDDRSGENYALAVLNKTKLRADLADKIAEQENIVNSELRNSRGSGSPIEKLISLDKALKALDNKKGLLTKKRIVDPENTNAKEMSGDITYAEIRKLKENAIKDILFYVTVEGEGDVAQLKNLISEKITKEGFNIINDLNERPKVNTSVVVLKCSFKIFLLERGLKGWDFLGWQGTLQLIEGGPGGKILASTAPNGTVSQLNEAAAREKAFFTVKKTIPYAAGVLIKSYFFGNE